MRRLRAWLVALVVVIGLASGAAVAFAEGIFIERGGAIEVTAREFRFGGTEREATACNFTLSGTLMSGSITAVEGRETQIGNLTRASLGSCTGGAQVQSISLGFPRRIYGTYERGVPTAERITWRTWLATSYLRLFANGNSCLYSGTVYGTKVSERNPTLITSLSVPSQSVGQAAGPLTCPPFDLVGGTWNLSPGWPAAYWVP